ncbi:NAD(P)H-hydrate repair Nnr-like enzyme with NAD(P)H-hydrate dehydratase domain [Crossiella equi]|uniref:NAD(P)H-hydrate repair Nnr-like enzyme with NAD(P)H-hydrate dehydratase domain n=1 Tax=Crossiella equi TaxID=130796 RepID=A0ABS5A504_9PSEU|nr:hypothetical protein [Crossiella equi]MBP2471668.1 NAD(P)H-hydrate repair Nnr-like enzyme with NAD(P)H-hydrate dehydratase domain [Crossiella equi]
MDPISLAVGGGLLLVGYVAGLLSRRRVRDKPVEAVCGCTHTMAMHDRETGACHEQIARPRSYSEKGKYLGTVYAQCTCRQYVGPRPIEEVFAPKLLPPVD